MVWKRFHQNAANDFEILGILSQLKKRRLVHTT